jgi:hypothetical protein
MIQLSEGMRVTDFIETGNAIKQELQPSSPEGVTNTGTK